MSDDVSREVFDEVVKRNELQNSIVRGWTILGVLAAVCALAFAGVQWYLAAKGV